MIYHNAASINEARKLLPVKPRAALPDLPADGHPLTPREQFWRRVRNRFRLRVQGLAQLEAARQKLLEIPNITKVVRL